MSNDKSDKAGTAAGLGGVATGNLLMLLGVGGLLLGGGYLAYKLISGLTGKEQYDDYIDEYRREMDELLGYQASISGQGNPATDQQIAIMNNMLSQMQWKEENYPDPVIVELREQAEDALKSFGLFVVLPLVIGYIGWQAWKHYHKKDPPSTPGGTIDGEAVATEEEAEELRDTGYVLADASAFAAAQSHYEQLPALAQNYIAVQSGLYSTVEAPWPGLSVYMRKQLANAFDSADIYAVAGTGAYAAELQAARQLMWIAVI